MLIAKAAKFKRGSHQPNQKIVGNISTQQLYDIAKVKLPDLNAHDIEQAMNIAASAAKNMRVKINK